MTKEAPETTQQDVFEFINKHMSRGFNESEILGLQKLIKEYGPAEIMGRVLDFVSEMENDPLPGADKIDQVIDHLEDDKEHFGIHDWIRREIEAEDVLPGLDSSNL